MKRIRWFEPWVFLWFGVFHLHRVWGFGDREAYAAFWMRVLLERDWLYYGLMGLLAGLCLMGMAAFFKNLHYNGWWRWFYLFAEAMFCLT